LAALAPPSLHDALPISLRRLRQRPAGGFPGGTGGTHPPQPSPPAGHQVRNGAPAAGAVEDTGREQPPGLGDRPPAPPDRHEKTPDRKSTRLNSSHVKIS